MSSQPTYTALAEITLDTTDSAIIFQNLPSNLAHLVITLNYKASSSVDLCMRFNSNTTNYEILTASATGSSQTSTFPATATYFRLGTTSTNSSFVNISIFDYLSTTKFKGILWRSSEPGVKTLSGVGEWRLLSAISSISLFPASGTFSAGTTAALYGVIS